MSFRAVLTLLTLAAATATSAAPVAGVWTEPSLQPLVHLPTLNAWLQQAGLEPEPLSTGDLLDPERLSPERLALLVLPYGGAYPAEGRAALEHFAAGGGSYVVFGGAPFGELLFDVDGKLVALDAMGEVALAPIGPPGTTQGSNDAVTVGGAGTPKQPFRLSVADLQGWAGLTLPVADLPAGAAGLEFEARGDESTRHMFVELRERDGSRWKQVVPLSPGWRTYRLHTGRFAAYASESRYGADDHVRPEQVVELSVGVTRGLAGTGPRSLELRNVRFRTAAVAPERVPAGLLPEALRADVAAAYPTLAPAGPPWPTAFGPGALLDSVALETPAGDAVPGAYTAATLEPAADAAFQPWLLGAPTRGGEAQAVAGAVAHADGPYAGGIWAMIGVRDATAGLDQPSAAMPDLLRDLTTAPVVGALVPRVDVIDGRATVTLSQRIVGRTQPARAMVTLNHGGRVAAREIDLAPRQAVEVSSAPRPLSGIADIGAAATSSVEAAGTTQTRTWQCDPRASLRELADFFAAAGADDGQLRGVGFVDQRGIRALLGAYEIFGDERYREVALLWGRATMAEQRDDGGYRMGYGITPLGEECYVADGGEIAIGIARLVSYADGPERQRLLDSLAGYMAYRDSFRVEGGGIGVGWCLHDYGQRPIVKLDTPTRIYAPERNLYTIGCTLAAAYADAHLRGDPALQAAAEADADWYMERAQSLSGASAESFTWAHALTPDPARRQLYADYLRERFVDKLRARKGDWWLGSGGRAALDIDSLAYVYDRIDPSPEVLAELAKGVYGFCATSSPTAAARLYDRPALKLEDWIYLCYGGVGLADVVEPMVTMEGLGER